MPTCIHGRLAWSCVECNGDQKDAVILSLEATAARLTAENERMRRVVALFTDERREMRVIRMNEIEDADEDGYFIREDDYLAALDAKNGGS